METDLILLARYHQDGDTGAFQSLVRAHAGMVFAAARRITQDAALAEEVAQDTFLALARRGWSVRESVAAWLHHVARQKACDVLRGELRRHRREQAAAEVLIEKQDGSWAEIEPVVDEVINELPEMSRVLLIEHFLEQRPQQEMARRLGMSQSTVSRQIEAALQMLRDGLKQRGVMAGIGLAGLLSTNTAQAAPAALTASLNKIAMTGIRSGTPGAASAATLFLTMTATTKAILAIAVVAAITIPFLLAHDPPPTPAVLRPLSVPRVSSRSGPPKPPTASPLRPPGISGLDPISQEAEQAIADDRKLILAEFTRLGGAINEEFADDDINRIVRENFGNDRTAFELALAQEGQSLEQFKAQRGEMMIISVMKARVTKDITDPAARKRAVDDWLTELRLKSVLAAPKAAARPAEVD